MSGKNASGLRGFPTPNNVSPDGGYVVFRLPENNEWAGLILGAAQALSYAYNFYEWGDMTPDEAAEAFRQIVDVAPFNTCGCVLPTGGKIIRINVSGHFEELGEDGSWQEPTGDYEIPPVPTRGGSDPRCLAAANAENVLSQLYEEVVDMIAEGLSLIEIIGAVILFIATVIAGAIGLAAAALIEIIAIAFREFVAAAAFLGADVWDETFSNALRCMLYDCASDDAGVVTFDWDCLIEKLYQNTNPDLTGAQLRLLGQVGFLLNIISIDGLNLAGATTVITEADCDDCSCSVELWDNCEYGTIENIGGVRWRVTGGATGGGSYSACIKGTLDECWCYCNYEVVSGAITYEDFRDCENTVHVAHPSPCGGGLTDSDILSWFIYASGAPFVIEFDAYCQGEAPACIE